MKISLITIIFFLVAHLCFAQSNEKELFDLLAEKDEQIFTASFVTCDYEVLNMLISDDLEFYHDQGGMTLGKEEFIETTKNGLCKDQGKTTRELIKSSLKVFPLADEGRLYAAIQTGEHLFYETASGLKEGNSYTIAKFTHLWMLIDGKWKIKRVLSYDHQQKQIPLK
ncbi:nuclear transport factor 2 family protein [Sungkyunkwania multivorans]|uniref:Nuclear transport factor 2 family protein n=1 Tax=Sungkyunkwania multivorans TaxID=1173618 RepID=A0ABW3CTB8_9FLAO